MKPPCSCYPTSHLPCGIESDSSNHWESSRSCCHQPAIGPIFAKDIFGISSLSSTKSLLTHSVDQIPSRLWDALRLDTILSTKVSLSLLSLPCLLTIPQGCNDLLPRQLHALLYQNLFHDQLYLPLVSPFPTESTFTPPRLPSDPLPSRIRIGFLSAYFYHHSVGLLLQGVIRHLSRDLFSVTTFFLPPIVVDPVSEVLHLFLLSPLSI
jgi:hypothetical protein